MNILKKTEEKLRSCPHIKFEVFKFQDFECITVKPESDEGFEVSLFLYNDGEFQVCGKGWRYEELDLKDDEAVSKFLLCLSSKSRLKVSSRGNKDYEWQIEVEDNGEWTQDTAVTNMPALLSCFWKRKSEKIFQNNYIC